MQRQGKTVFVLLMAAGVLFLVLAVRHGLFGKARTQGSCLPEEDAALRYPYQQLSGKEQQLYTALYDAMAAHEESVVLPYECTADEYERIYLMVRMQEPELFYVADTYQLADVLTETEIRYDETAEEAAAMQRQLDRVVDEMLLTMSLQPDEGQKLLTLHDLIAKRCRYAPSSHASDIYGCLVEGVAQCEGYSKAFCYVARKAGLQVMTIPGESDRGLGHAWNIAEIDGEFYNIDVTWDDEDYLNGAVSHRYYAMPDTRFGGHFANPSAFRVPECTADKENYYKKYGLVLNESSQMGTYCHQWALSYSGATGFLEFYCPTPEIYQAVAEDIRSGTAIKSAIADLCTGGSFRYTADEQGRIVGILFE